MRNPTTPKSGVRGVTWNSQFDRWHVRVRVSIDGRFKYASFGLFDTVDEAAEVARKARAGDIEPNSLKSRAARTRADVPRYVTRRGTPPPDLTAVATADLITELNRRHDR